MEPPETPPINHLEQLRTRWQDRRLRWITGATAGVIVLLGVTLLTTSHTTHHAAPTAAAPHFKNWLKPASTLMVGKNRYVSPCRVLPMNDIAHIFRPFAADTAVQEEYLDQSYVGDDVYDNTKTSCQYYTTGSGDETFYISLTQYNQFDDGTAWAEFSPVDDTSAELARYKAVVAHSNNQDAKQFVQALTTTSKAVSNDFFTLDDLHKAHAAAIDTGALGVQGDFAFKVLYGNVVYSIRDTLSGTQHLKDRTQYSSQTLVTELARMQKAFTVIKHNAANTQLDQSPAPTILGKTDKFGSTTILEPCALLTPSIFSAALGVAQNKPVNRLTLPIDFSKQTTSDGITLPKTSSCERGYSDIDTSGDSFSLSLTLHTGPSATATKAWAENHYANRPTYPTAPLQTNADWAIVYRSTAEPNDPQANFRVGPYAGTIDIMKTTGLQDFGDGTDLPIADATLVQIVNQVVANIPRH